MPARKVPEWEKEKRSDLRERFGGMMNMIEIQRELGAKDPKTARAFLEDLPYILVGKQKKWDVADVARRMNERREGIA